MTLHPRRLTRERFAPFGDVIETAERPGHAMNSGRFERFAGLSQVETDAQGRASIGIVRCRVATPLPFRFDTVERHPDGSQAFVPLTPFPFVLVVAPRCERLRPADLRAFVTTVGQGVNYRRGTWHMPLIASEAGQEFLVVDRVGIGSNYQEHVFDRPVTLGEIR